GACEGGRQADHLHRPGNVERQLLLRSPLGRKGRFEEPGQLSASVTPAATSGPDVRRRGKRCIARRVAGHERLRSGSSPAMDQRSKDEAIIAEMNALSTKQIARLREILQQQGWPGKTMVGIRAAGAAWMIAQHGGT